MSKTDKTNPDEEEPPPGLSSSGKILWKMRDYFRVDDPELERMLENRIAKRRKKQ